MLVIGGSKINVGDIASEYPKNSIEIAIINKMVSSQEPFSYNFLNQLKFELSMRKNIISSSIELSRSIMKFKVFKESKCNKDYWERTKSGGFNLKEGAASSTGINDIFINSSKYATECSTAIVIIYYKAILSIYPEELFNNTFKNIVLLNWHSLNKNLRIYSSEIQGDYLPGDCLYFENPDYTPKKQEWQGENAIDLGNNSYYGHGIGITSAEQIIKSLNKHRKPDANKTAYLTKHVARPNFMHLADLYLVSLERMRFESFRYNIL